jgi:hypothetical protein
VYAAVIVTWVGATSTAAITLLVTVALLWIAAPMFDMFGSGADNPRIWLIGFAAIVIVVSVLADVIALFVMRGHRWAQWLLVILSVVAALGGVMAGYYIAPLAVTAAAVAVAVLLLLPDAQTWFRGPSAEPGQRT